MYNGRMYIHKHIGLTPGMHVHAYRPTTPVGDSNVHVHAHADLLILLASFADYCTP